MSTAARKARKRAGVPFVKAAKRPTPPEERSDVQKDLDGAVRRVLRRLRAEGADVDEASVRAAAEAEAGR